MSPKKKKSPKRSAAVVERDKLKLQVAILEARVARVEKDIAPTVALRQNLAERIRLERKLQKLKSASEEIILNAAPPARHWWQQWWDALFLGPLNQTVNTVNTATATLLTAEAIRDPS